MTVTVTDLFCGAGGSSLGAETAGATLRLGLNHWDHRANNVPRDADREPTHPILTGGTIGVVHLRNNGRVRDAEAEPAGTVSAGGGHHGIVVAHYRPGWARRAAAEPFGSITTTDSHSLLVPPGTATVDDRVALVVPPMGNAEPRVADREPSPTQTTTTRAALVEVTDDEIDGCRFRMFELPEIARTMAMDFHHNGDDYVVVGNKRERMALYGNAVTPPAMNLLVSRLLQILDAV